MPFHTSKNKGVYATILYNNGLPDPVAIPD